MCNGLPELMCAPAGWTGADLGSLLADAQLGAITQHLDQAQVKLLQKMLRVSSNVLLMMQGPCTDCICSSLGPVQ